MCPDPVHVTLHTALHISEPGVCVRTMGLVTPDPGLWGHCPCPRSVGVEHGAEGLAPRPCAPVLSELLSVTGKWLPRRGSGKTEVAGAAC